MRGGCNFNSAAPLARNHGPGRSGGQTVQATRLWPRVCFFNSVNVAAAHGANRAQADRTKYRGAEQSEENRVAGSLTLQALSTGWTWNATRGPLADGPRVGVL
jgi:hypothetical protein